MGFMLQEGYAETCARTGRETRFWPMRRERSDRTQSNILKRLPHSNYCVGLEMGRVHATIWAEALP